MLCDVTTRFDDRSQTGRRSRIRGWSIGGAGTKVAATVERALSRAEVPLESVDAFFGVGIGNILEPGEPRASRIFDPEPTLGHAPSWSSAAACVAALAWLKSHPSATVVVADPGERSSSVALVLQGDAQREEGDR